LCCGWSCTQKSAIQPTIWQVGRWELWCDVRSAADQGEQRPRHALCLMRANNDDGVQHAAVDSRCSLAPHPLAATQDQPQPHRDGPTAPPPPTQGNEAVSQRSLLTPEQKQRRVVLKRVNLDSEGIRQDFLKVPRFFVGEGEGPPLLFGGVAGGGLGVGGVVIVPLQLVGRFSWVELGHSASGHHSPPPQPPTTTICRNRLARWPRERRRRAPSSPTCAPRCA